MGQRCDSSCRYYGVDANYNGYCKKDFNSYRERGAACTFEQTDNKSTASPKSSSSSSSSSSGGCYVATAVYGSYDCPEVWTLRRYRDDILAETWYGRVFIRFYYAISPTLVKWFGRTAWFKKMWQGKLDRKVKKLNNIGVQNTPYQDRDWLIQHRN